MAITVYAKRVALTGAALLIWCQFFAWLPAAAAAESQFPSVSLPLAKLMPTSQPIRLRYTADEFTLYVPLSQRVRVKSALLHLQLTNSISLIKDRSQLTVRLNGRVMAQIMLNPQQPESSADVRLPGSLLKQGYNKLVFSVAQHYTLKCEEPSAPELWTEIDTVASTLTFDGDLAPLSPRLSSIPDLLDPKLWGDPSLTVVTASAPPMRDEQLQWGALVAQGAALRFRYVPLRIVHEVAAPAATSAAAGTANFPGLRQDSLRLTDSALVGTRTELAQYLSKRVLERITGSFLGVYALDANPSRFVLVVSGTTPAEVTQAARSLTFLNFPYPDAPTMLVSAIEYPALADYAGRNTVTENGAYKFSQFAFKTATVKGAATSSLINEEHIESLEIEIVMPPDLFAHEDTNVDLFLHFAYGAGLRKDSVLNIMLNERFERAIGLTVDGGVVYKKYQISIPLRSFQPGVNRIRFSPRMMPLITGECQAIQTENLILTLYDDSTLQMPKASHFVAMPNLKLLARSGFPYTIKPDGSGALINVASNDSKTVAAAWMLMAKLAQRHVQALQQAVISFAPPQQDRDVIVVGSVDKIQAKLLQGAPVGLGKDARVPYPVAAERPGADEPHGLLERLFPGTSRPLEATAAGISGKSVVLTETGDMGASALAMQYRSPAGGDKTTVVLTAANEDVLLQAVTQLVKPEIWDNLQGNVVIWKPDAEALSWQKAGGEYTVGSVNVPARLEFYFSRYPWFWFATLLALGVVLAWITATMLRRYRRKHHPQEPARRDSD